MPDPSLLSGVIVLGGAMGVHETERFPFLNRVRDFMRHALRLGVPLLGICLGGQLLAEILGGSVTPASGHGEKGIGEVRLTREGCADPLFASVPDPFITFQWHADSFLPPAAATLLASSAVCPWQAFRFRENAYGLQFHPEVDRGIVSHWSAGCPEEEALLAAFDQARSSFERHCHAVLANFIRLARHA